MELICFDEHKDRPQYVFCISIELEQRHKYWKNIIFFDCYRSFFMILL